MIVGAHGREARMYLRRNGAASSMAAHEIFMEAFLHALGAKTILYSAGVDQLGEPFLAIEWPPPRGGR
jgi:hypothetical protein